VDGNHEECYFRPIMKTLEWGWKPTPRKGGVGASEAEIISQRSRHVSRGSQPAGNRSQEGGHCSGDEERRGALSYLGRHYPRRYSDENRCVSHAGGIYRKARWKGDASHRLGRRSHRGRLARVLLHVRRSTSSRGAVICQQETAEGPTGNPMHDWCTLLRGSSLLDGGHSA
jgi:hypothetical protein